MDFKVVIDLTYGLIGLTGLLDVVLRGVGYRTSTKGVTIATKQAGIFAF